VIGRFLTELRDRRIVGVRTTGGKVLVPPLEYDPETGDSILDSRTGPDGHADGACGVDRARDDGSAAAGRDEPFVEVGPAGTVQTWAWVSAPRRSHPLDRPFAWAMSLLDGADTSLVHVVDVESSKEMRPGMRVRPRWREPRVGHITDIECFVPEVTTMISPIRSEYRVRPGRALTRFLEGLRDGVFIAGRCAECDKVYVPYRISCPSCGSVIDEEVEVSDAGTVTTFAINNLPDPRAPDVPFVSAYILLDGADIPMIALVGGIPAHEVRQGMRVRAVWLPPEERTTAMTNVTWFAPTGEPDVDLSGPSGPPGRA
jgi:uncharacterized OB-fold protein